MVDARYAHAPMSSPLDATQTDVEPTDVADLMAGDSQPQLIDVREPYEREAGHISGSVHIPLVELSARAGEIDRERPVIFYCRVGARSGMAAQAFRAAGYTAASMTGGLVRWVSESRPLTPENGYVADH